MNKWVFYQSLSLDIPVRHCEHILYTLKDVISSSASAKDKTTGKYTNKQFHAKVFFRYPTWNTLTINGTQPDLPATKAQWEHISIKISKP